MNGERSTDPDEVVRDLAARFLDKNSERECPVPEVEGFAELVEIGSGGSGIVYSAVQTGLNRLVAIKVFRPFRESQFSSLLKRRFDQECEVLGQLKHQNIVQVFLNGECEYPDGRRAPFFVMEYVGGKDLRVRIEKGTVPLSDAKPIMEQICSGVSAAHRLGILHRDIKPENVLLDENGVCKVSDFGNARNLYLSQRLTSQAPSMGTRGYIAPEVLKGMAGDERADVYACGIVLYELLTGEVPRANCKPVSKVCADVDESWDRLIVAAIADDPAERFPSVEDFGKALLSPTVLTSDREATFRGSLFFIPQRRNVPNIVDPWSAAEPAHHFGRHMLTQRLGEAYNEMQSISLVGDRRIGKSSTLLLVQSQLSSFSPAVRYVSGDDKDGSSPTALVQAVTGQHVPDDTEAAADQLSRWVDSVGLPGLAPILLLDDADSLIRRFDERFFERIRGMLDRLVVIIATKHEIDLLYDEVGRTSPFHSRLAFERIGLLESEDAKR